MARETRCTYAGTLAWGGDTPTAELEVEWSYTVRWGAPARGPSYASGGEPADPDEIEDIRILTVDDKPWPVDLFGGYQTERENFDTLENKIVDEFWDEMIESAIEKDCAS